VQQQLLQQRARDQQLHAAPLQQQSCRRSHLLQQRLQEAQQLPRLALPSAAARRLTGAPRTSVAGPQRPRSSPAAAGVVVGARAGSAAAAGAGAAAGLAAGVGRAHAPKAGAAAGRDRVPGADPPFGPDPSADHRLHTKAGAGRLPTTSCLHQSALPRPAGMLHSQQQLKAGR
jgi:hypothetical protein